MRQVNLVLITDKENSESRIIEKQIISNLPIQVQTIPIQIAKEFLPGISAVPAIGVLLWSSDLQGIAADIENFSKYITKEDEIVQTINTLGLEINNNINFQAENIHSCIQTMACSASDEIIVSQPKNFYDTWKPNEKYVYNQPIVYKEQIYRIVQPDGITSIESQPPDLEGMLSVYRPINIVQSGTFDDPIQWVYGMDCYKDKYYLYNENKYLCNSDLIPCIWPPDTLGLWQFTLVTDEPGEEWPEWVQPTGAHDAYNTGDKVSHNGKHWTSDVDGNTWEPGAYGWTESK